MRREVDLAEISDGVLYRPGDMVRVGCHDCEGCSACCWNMEALVLDPLDIFRLTTGLQRPFEDFLDRELELKIVDQMILPQMRMQQNTGACAFLGENGRCRIHPLRPGICRLFPLGRTYEDGDFSYFLQIHECAKKNRYKVKLSQWIDEPEPEKNRAFLNAWHSLQVKTRSLLPDLAAEERRSLLLYLLKLFYQIPYTGEDFYRQFDRRMERSEKDLETSFRAN